MTRLARILELRSLQMLSNLISSGPKITFNHNQVVNSPSLLQIKYSFRKVAGIAENRYKLQEGHQHQQLVALSEQSWHSETRNRAVALL